MTRSWTRVLSKCGKVYLSIIIALVAASMGAPSGGTIAAPPERVSGQAIQPTKQLTIADAKGVGSFAERNLPDLKEIGGSTAGLQESPIRFNRPTMSADQYAAAKEQAAAVPKAPKPAAAQNSPPTPYQSFSGTNQTEGCPIGCIPPDSHGAAGGGVAKQLVEIGNSFLAVYVKGTGQRLKLTSLNAFFGVPLNNNFNNLLFDPRVIYDPYWNRWVISADEFAADPTHQYVDIAISSTDDATGGYYLYRFNIISNAGDFWDFPQLGMDQDAIFSTANVFNGTSYVGAEMFAWPKALAYNGRSFSAPIYTGLEGTLAPPMVLDDNTTSFFLSSPASGTAFKLYAFQNSSRLTHASLTLQSSVNVPAYTLPPNAPQPRTTALLDTNDGRFVNSSTQVGNSLYQVHTIGINGVAVPQWYKIDTSANSVAADGQFSATNSSYDFNASIAANGQDEIFVTWNSTDPANNTNPQVRISGKQSGEMMIGAGTAIVTSANPYGTGSGVSRWGDYSAVSLEPVANSTCGQFRRAWVINQKSPSPTVWGTQIGKMGYCN